MADLKEVKINDTDAFHPASEVFPRIHHPKIFHPVPQTHLFVCCVPSLPSARTYTTRTVRTPGLVPNSACKIRAKLKSRQSIMLAAGFENVDFNKSDAG